MAEVFSAEVTVSIAKYAAEIAKIEAETSKSATKASVALVKQLTAGQKQAGDVANAAARRAGEAWEDAARQTTMAGSAANGASVSYGNLINQLADIGKGVAGGQSPLTILTQQGEQVYFALSQAGGATAVLKAGLAALAPFAPHIVAIGAAVAALGYAWNQATKELDAANLKMEESARIAAEAQEAYENLSKVQMSTTDKWLVATGQATDKDLELRDSVASITEVYGPRIKAEQEAIKAAKAAAVAGYEQMTQQNAQGDAIQKGAKAWRENTAAVEAAEKRLAGLTQEQGVYLQRAAIGILTEDNATESRKRGTKAIRDRINALQEENDLAAKNSKTYHDALNSIDGMSFGLKKNKDDVELLSDAYHENLDAINKAEAEALAVVTDGSDAADTARKTALNKRLEAEAAFYRDLEALRKASEEKANKAAEDGAKLRAEVEAKEANARAREYQRQLETFTDVADAIQGIGRNGAAGMFADMSAEIVGATGEARKLKQELLSGDISALEFADSMRELTRDTTRSLVNTLGDGLGSVFQARFDDLAALAAEASAVAAGASSDVIKFQESIEASQLAQREAADLTGQALRRAYELGVVGVDDLSDAQRKQIESSLLAEEAAAEKKQKAANKAAKNAWAATQASAASQAAILTLLAVSQALASVPPPFNIPVAGLALAAGIAQEAAIASAKPPSFRRGGSAMPDERQVVASVEDGELLQVTSRQGAAKARSDANNAGMSAPIGGTGTALVLNGRDIGRIIEAGVQSARGRRAVTQAPARGRAPRKGS